MAYGRGLAHERLENEFADYVGMPYAVAVGSGGMALQMSIRALGLVPGDEVIHQVDTCSATAMAVMNAGATPIFADVSPRTFLLDRQSVKDRSSARTRALIVTHTWGNPDAAADFLAVARENDGRSSKMPARHWGRTADGKPAGSWGDTGVFSFGCLKPVQAGEGGMIVTRDEALAKELRSLRHWGDRTIDFGVRDVTQLSWNGRMSELVAAVAREQLRGYPPQLRKLRESVADFCRFLEDVPELRAKFGAANSPLRRCMHSARAGTRHAGLPHDKAGAMEGIGGARRIIVARQLRTDQQPQLFPHAPLGRNGSVATICNVSPPTTEPLIPRRRQSLKAQESV